MTDVSEIVAILVPLSIATLFSIILCITMLCCYIRQKNRRSLSPNNNNTRTRTEDDNGIGGIELENKVNEGRYLKVYEDDPKPKMIENRPMYITETIGGGSRANSLSHKNSLSTIFSSLGDLMPSDAVDSKEDDLVLDISTPNYDIIERKLGDTARSSKRYYTLTYTTPELKQKSKEGSFRSITSSVSSKSQSNSNHPVHRIRVLRSSAASSENRGSRGSNPNTPPLPPIRYSSSSQPPSSGRSVLRSEDRQQKMSSAANELSSILEGSLEKPNSSLETSVFETPHNTNPYFPNPNTPVSADDEDAVVSQLSQLTSNKSSYLPPYNTPNQTGSDVMARAVWSSQATRDGLTMDDTIQSLHEMKREQAKLRNGSDVYSDQPTPNTHEHSLSILSQELNMITQTVPIHCSTITGVLADEARHGDRPDTTSSRSCLDQTTKSEGYVYNLATRTMHITNNIDESETIQKSEAEWHYNHAYERSTIDFSRSRSSSDPSQTGFQADLSSSGAIRGGYVSSANSQLKPNSGHTSLNPQVGSRDTTLHPSDVYDPPYHSQKNLVHYSDITDSTMHSQDQTANRKELNSYHQHMGPDSATLQAPANSPQTTITDGNRRRIKSSNSHRRYKGRQPQLPPTAEDMSAPLLAPEVYWV